MMFKNGMMIDKKLNLISKMLVNLNLLNSQAVLFKNNKVFFYFID